MISDVLLLWRINGNCGDESLHTPSDRSTDWRRFMTFLRERRTKNEPLPGNKKTTCGCGWSGKVKNFSLHKCLTMKCICGQEMKHKDRASHACPKAEEAWWNAPPALEPVQYFAERVRANSTSTSLIIVPWNHSSASVDLHLQTCMFGHSQVLLHGQIASELRRVSFAFSDAKPRLLQFSLQKMTIIWAHSKNPYPSMLIKTTAAQQPVCVLFQAFWPVPLLRTWNNWKGNTDEKNERLGDCSWEKEKTTTSISSSR